MRAARWLLGLTLLLTSVAPALAGEALFEFSALRGVPTPSLTIRNLIGGGVPWTLAGGEARLDGGGFLKVEVEGLVLAAGPNAGTNPVPAFFATLSCRDANGNVVNIDTSSAPATPTGDARIEQVVTLPSICLGPIVFVRSATNGRWFAISGF